MSGFFNFVKATDTALNAETPRAILISEVTSEVRRLCELRALMRAGKREAPAIDGHCETRIVNACDARDH